MNLNYLQTEIIPLRKKEIEEGKNLATRQPIYIVLELKENYISGHPDSDYHLSTSKKALPMEFGYFDMGLETEHRRFKKSKKKMNKPEKVTRFFTDEFVAFFFTSKSAHDYLDYQSHNLRKAYVYVFYSGYGNREMDALLNNQ